MIYFPSLAVSEGTRRERWKYVYCIFLLDFTTGELLPVDLSVLVEILQAFKHVLQHSSNGGLVQNAGLVFPSGDDMFDHVQHGAWIVTTRNNHLLIKNNAHCLALLRSCWKITFLLVNINVIETLKLPRNNYSCSYLCS